MRYLNKKIIVLLVIITACFAIVSFFVFRGSSNVPTIEVSTNAVENSNIAYSGVKDKVLQSISKTDLAILNAQMIEFVKSSTQTNAPEIKGVYRDDTLKINKNQFGSYLSYIIDFPDQKISYKTIIPNDGEYNGVSIICVNNKEMLYKKTKCKDSFSE